MRKRIASLFLSVVLCMAALVPAALASGYGETRVGFTVGGNDNFYPYGKAASGAGWSYDGNQTITLNGISLSEKNADVFQLCNPDRNLTVVIAAGSVNTMGSLETMYKMGSTRHVTVTFTGTGTINCSRYLHFGSDDIIFSGPTASCEGGFYCGKLTMNSGFIHTESLYLGGTNSVLNGGGIEFEATKYGSFSIDSSDQAAGQALFHLPQVLFQCHKIVIRCMHHYSSSN